ncbi:hypothetical protein BJ742DRAFT_878736 [Cladochytrium replicatum]|nr:hypothetical protein BJ742DRAFT_878736 [Cladochytrium replicatum]
MSIDSMAEKIISDTVNSATGGLSNSLNGISASTLVFLRSIVARTFMSTQTRGYGYNTEFNYLATQLIQSTPGMVNLICGQANNVTGEVPSSWYSDHDYPNGTSYLLESSLVYFADYSTGNSSYFAPVDNATGRVVGIPTRNPVPTSLILKNGSGYRLMGSGICEPIWLSEIVQVPHFTFAACAEPMNITDVFGVAKQMITYACGSVTPVSDATKLLVQLTPTRNTRLFLTNAEGSLVVANMNIIPAATASDTYIAEISQTVTHQSSQITQTVTTRDGSIWKVATKKLNLRDGNSNFWFTIAIPRDDFFSEVESSIRRGIVISCVSSGLGLLGAFAVTVLIVLPVRRMVYNMSKATKFEFQELEENIKLTRPSMFSELRILQESFADMVKTFATAIQKNRDLADSRR